ncbi:hypothetical protein OM076_13535 [Solirubrobacter ginsenosidimutans]|uniref:Uncharacterized protein n=1 Tax=Solirubrobacter ginsenosidimutans TaxID=490573 RepID=A0A9X3S0H0_9ACTN|nr:hypothetical protein [Solirubrobacter ginsenosidimutans]MDA0161294.1 hypothetical protein [Solirubrobacter ginsenosidimutans]
MARLDPKTVVGTLGTLSLGVITLLTVFAVVDWSAAQTALLTAELAAITGFAAALVAHLKPGTAQEHVALAATFTATVSTTLALGTAFDWWTLTGQEVSALVGVVTALTSVGSAMIARQHVRELITPNGEPARGRRPPGPPVGSGSDED